VIATASLYLVLNVGLENYTTIAFDNIVQESRYNKCS